MDVRMLKRASILKSYYVYTFNRASLSNCSRILYCQKTGAQEPPQPKVGDMKATFRPNAIDKWLLVWMKKYPSMAEVPGYVPESMMERVRNRARIKITAYICLVSIFAFAAMAYSGKAAVKRGESIKTVSEEFHRSMREKDQK